MGLITNSLAAMMVVLFIQAQMDVASTKSTAISGLFRGKVVEFKDQVAKRTVKWKQGSVFGFGGDRKQTYKECHYTLDGKIIVVFVQSNWKTPKPLRMDGKLQYGLNKGDVFFVLHDKKQKPYQHRFVMTPMQKALSYANAALKGLKGYDASWIAGDYLHNL